MAKLADEDKTFVWVKRQLDWDVGQQIAALDIKGIYQRKEYKRQYPEGEAAAHVVGFTNVEDKGQEGHGAGLQQRAGRARRLAPRDQGPPGPRGRRRGRDHAAGGWARHAAVHRQQGAVLCLPKAARPGAAHKAKAGSVVVLDAHTGEVLALANYPSYVPDKRQNLTGEQLRNRALTDVFEPGSTMKPFTIGLALESGRAAPDTDRHLAGRITITGSTISDTHNYGALTVEGVIQKSSNVGTTKIAMQMPAREMWETFSAAGFGQKPQLAFPAWSVAVCALQDLAPDRAGHHVLRLRPVGQPVPDGALVHRVCQRGASFLPPCSRPTEPAVGVPVFSERTADQVRKMLQMAAGPGGTGQKAQTVGYSVGGKSGTARKQVGKSYAAGKYRAWFTGMAPIDKPRIIVAVMIDEPSNGQVLRRPGGRAGVQRGGAADPAHDGRAARHGRQAADRGRRGGGVAVMHALTTAQAADAVQWLRERVTGTLQTDSR
jgi:cell division protein FtsI (penicillin-binding protein 3)